MDRLTNATGNQPFGSCCSSKALTPWLDDSACIGNHSGGLKNLSTGLELTTAFMFLMASFFADSKK